MWRNHMNKVAELWKSAQLVYLSQVGYKSLVLRSSLKKELFESTT